jgi:transposase
MYKCLYLGLDAHKRSCVLSAINSSGDLVFVEDFSTSETALISRVAGLPADDKYLAVEESSLAGWIAATLRPYVSELTVCDPRHNALISRDGNKSDLADAFKLARLLRMGELKPVYHSDVLHRVDFKIAVQQYLSFREDHASVKKQIKAKYQQAGMVRTAGTKLFNPTQRGHYLRQLPSKTRQEIMANLYTSLDATGALRNKARAAMTKLGRRYPEISQFQRMPGVGIVGAHVFSAFIQNPHRFATKQRLWRYCRLGVVERSSAGKPLAYKRLDRSGRGPLKAVSHQCYVSALRTKEPNEVSRFYEASLRRTGNPLHARLNTQRKVLAVLWTIWKNNVSYQPNLFYPPPTSAGIAQTVANP